MRSFFALVLCSSLLVFVPAALAVPVDIVGPHQDGNGGSVTCTDAILGTAHVGICEGSASCPLYYDTYGIAGSGCRYELQPQDLTWLPFFEIVGPHNDGNPTGAECSDIVASSVHLGTCEGALGCPVYYDDYMGDSGCLP